VYIPRHFEQPEVGAMHDVIRAHPLATLVTQSAHGLTANHIPLHLEASVAPWGVLQGHVARVNPILQDFAAQRETLAVFHGPQSYISPSLYATKEETGKVVPTWNYVVVHAYGKVRVMDDAQWIRAQIEALTNQQEESYPTPWAVADAPGDYTEKLIANIVGFEMAITGLSGKWKLSQNQPAKNRTSVVERLNANGQQAASTMAMFVQAAMNEDL
jgi:transcriptional regulator